MVPEAILEKLEPMTLVGDISRRQVIFHVGR